MEELHALEGTLGMLLAAFNAASLSALLVWVVPRAPSHQHQQPAPCLSPQLSPVWPLCCWRAVPGHEVSSELRPASRHQGSRSLLELVMPQFTSALLNLFCSEENSLGTGSCLCMDACLKLRVGAVWSNLTCFLLLQA